MYSWTSFGSGFMSEGCTAGTMRALGMIAARTLPRAAWTLRRRGRGGSAGGQRDASADVSTARH